MFIYSYGAPLQEFSQLDSVSDMRCPPRVFQFHIPSKSFLQMIKTYSYRAISYTLCPALKSLLHINTAYFNLSYYGYILLITGFDRRFYMQWHKFYLNFAPIFQSLPVQYFGANTICFYYYYQITLYFYLVLQIIHYFYICIYGFSLPIFYFRICLLCNLLTLSHCTIRRS